MTETPSKTPGNAEISENLATVRAAMAAATAKRGDGAGARPVTLVAVSKTFGAERIRPALDAGQRVFGENRVQEAGAKWPDLKADFPDARLHLIGPLQTNKVKAAMDLFDVIETLDREKLARAIKKEMDKGTPSPDLFIQVNTGREDQKAGVAPEDADAFIALCRDEMGLPVRGLMCIPPVDEEPALHFALLDKIAARNGLVERSMGMSADFEVAIAFGATMVRVGSAIFGARTPQADT